MSRPRGGRYAMIRLFKHYVPVQLFYLAALEALILFLSMYAGVALRFSGLEVGDNAVTGSVFVRALVFTLVMMVTMTAFGMFTRESQTGDVDYYVRFLVSFVAGGIAMSFIFLSPADAAHRSRGVGADIHDRLRR